MNEVLIFVHPDKAFDFDYNTLQAKNGKVIAHPHLGLDEIQVATRQSGNIWLLQSGDKSMVDPRGEV